MHVQFDREEATKAFIWTSRAGFSIKPGLREYEYTRYDRGHPYSIHAEFTPLTRLK
jgi:hypothetical protein